MKEYPFNWKDIGDIQLGRPNLGQMIHVAVYRLMQYTMRAVLEERFDFVAVKEIFVEAGRLAGQNFPVWEVDCWSTGERTCRFTIDLSKK